jgi:hypothetical protein
MVLVTLKLTLLLARLVSEGEMLFLLLRSLMGGDSAAPKGASSLLWKNTDVRFDIDIRWLGAITGDGLDRAVDTRESFALLLSLVAPSLPSLDKPDPCLCNASGDNEILYWPTPGRLDASLILLSISLGPRSEKTTALARRRPVVTI